MKRAFRDAYNRELAILKERSTEFAADYPGIADRLGGLIEENLDPALQGLLEGSAFLAARVQLNIEEQFRTFTEELLDQVWGYSHTGYEHTVNSHINRLRKKIEKAPDDSRYIETVWGVGYRFRET